MARFLASYYHAVGAGIHSLFYVGSDYSLPRAFFAAYGPFVRNCLKIWRNASFSLLLAQHCSPLAQTHGQRRQELREIRPLHGVSDNPCAEIGCSSTHLGDSTCRTPSLDERLSVSSFLNIKIFRSGLMSSETRFEKSKRQTKPPCDISWRI